MKLIITLLCLCLGFTSLSAQENEVFKPHGKPIAKVYANWHQGMGNDVYKDDSGFEILRAVIGYEYNFSPYISTKVIFDTDNPSSGKLTEVAYLRNAYVAYKKDKLQAYFGVIGVKQFKTQENNWGYRYIYKSAMDEYKFNNSVDMGLYVKYKLTKWASADITISNGEGAKKQQDAEGKYRIGYGLELEPIKNLTFRTYYDYWYATEPTEGLEPKDQSSIAFFLGYEVEKFRIGAEFNRLWNFAFDDMDERDIYSIYGSYGLSSKLQAFARYDKLVANYANETNHVVLAGLDYKLVKGVQVSPNYRYTHDGDGVDEKGHLVYLNLEYKF